MLLRRITNHVKKENWFAVGIDFAIVVVGVFMGIQVSNWNSDRIERHQEQGLLMRLHEDFVESIKGQRRDLAFLEQQFSDQAVILKSLAACKVTREDTVAFQRGLVTLGYINQPRFDRRTIDELASTGKIDVIQNKLIKAELAAIVSQVEWRGSAHDSISRSADHHRYIIEGRLHYDLTRTHTDKFIGEFFGVVFEMRALCQNSSITSSVSAISQMTKERERALQLILEAYQEFIPTLELELQDRWQLDVSETAL